MEHQTLLELMKDMSLEEKVGQLIQVPAAMLGENGIITGPTGSIPMDDQTRGLIGSILGTVGAEKLIALQKEQMAMQPHHIPMLFMFDIINGHQTIFPIPLSQGCSFRPDLVEKAAHIAAKESAVSGLHVVFSPMLDLVRDPRWGRVMESPGEDPYLNSLMARAMVRGYQGKDLKEEGRVAACLKHFAGYGAPDGGREYDNVELSLRTLREDYLPSYAAAVDEGCRMAMSSFNTLDRIPSSGNKWLMRSVLRQEMGFNGVLISDYSAIEEMVNHGSAEDPRDAARQAMEASVDIDMCSVAYIGHLANLIREGSVEESLLDEAVLRVLTLKNDLGLFENPFKDADAVKEQALLLCDEHRRAAKDLAACSMVLLENDGILPLTPGKQKLALIGPHANNHGIYGSWSFPQDVTQIVTVRQGIERIQPNNVTCCTGSYMLAPNMCSRFGQFETIDPEQTEKWLVQALEDAKKADTVVICLGEDTYQSGEAGSRTVLQISPLQLKLLQKVHEVNENIVLVLFSGRPLETGELTNYCKALLWAGMPGTEGGNAIADLLFGICQPEGRLSMSFPHIATQAPLYYNHLPTGRPNLHGPQTTFCAGYIDESCYARYPFGYGLSYTRFDYSPVTLSADTMDPTGCINASVTVTNTGDHPGTETVQLYLRDIAGSVSRPVRMLKGFKKITLQPGQSQQVCFEIREDMLRFYDIHMNYTSEPGIFEVHIAANSALDHKAIFRLNQ